MFNFGDMVVFDKEYRSCKPNTIHVGQSATDVYAEMEAHGYESGDEIPCKTVFDIKPRQGVYLGTFTIHTAIYYDGGSALGVW